jgi:Ca2+/Na+ antiporter
LFFGFLAICLTGYVLSQAATNITDQFNISDVLFGVIILAIANTLPDKLAAVISGSRGHTGILVANTVGSNIFLLAFCIRIILVDTKGTLDGGNVTIPELAVLWASTVGFVLTVWFGGKFCRWIGVVIPACYAAFIVCEFTVTHRIAA